MRSQFVMGFKEKTVIKIQHLFQQFLTLYFNIVNFNGPW